eukprot:scaffold148_cov371-Prasinococcus_capsulatus_cf.AAC.5
MGINSGDLKKAKDAGISSVQGLLMSTRKDLANIKGLSDAKVEKILETARKAVVRNLRRLPQSASAHSRLSTAQHGLDNCNGSLCSTGQDLDQNNNRILRPGHLAPRRHRDKQLNGTLRGVSHRKVAALLYALCNMHEADRGGWGVHTLVLH